MNWADFKASWEADQNWADVGTWHWLDESLTEWSDKGHRPWLVVTDPGSGPSVQIVPRTTKRQSPSRGFLHPQHLHVDGLEDKRLCRLDQAGWICPRRRKGLRRELLADKQFYSCREPDQSVRKAAGCRE